MSTENTAAFCIGDKVFFTSLYLHEKMGLKSHEIVDLHQHDDGDWWYSIDRRNYFGASYISNEAPPPKGAR